MSSIGTVCSVLAVAGALALAACAPRIAYVDTFCTSYQPVHYSAAGDTPETKRQVQENNGVWTRLCK